MTQQHTHRFSQIKPVPNNHIEHQLFQPLYQDQRHLLSSSCSHTNTSSTNDPLSPPPKKRQKIKEMSIKKVPQTIRRRKYLLLSQYSLCGYLAPLAMCDSTWSFSQVSLISCQINKSKEENKTYKIQKVGWDLTIACPGGSNVDSAGPHLPVVDRPGLWKLVLCES